MLRALRFGAYPGLQDDLQHWVTDVGVAVVRAAVAPQHKLRAERRIDPPPTQTLGKLMSL